MQEGGLRIEGIEDTQASAEKVARALTKVQGVVSADVDPKAAQVRVMFNEADVELSTLVDAVRAEGYDAKPREED